MIRTLFIAGFSTVIILLSAGCDKEPLLPITERKERSNLLYRQALEAEQAGDLDQSITLLKKVVAEEPQAVSAHFQLAVLLQDHAKDYIGAIGHFRTYMELRPESDKVTPPKNLEGHKTIRSLVESRIQKAKETLAPQLLKELGESIEEISQARLLAENTSLKSQTKKLETERDALLRDKQGLDKTSREQAAQIRELKALVEMMKKKAVASDETAEKKRQIIREAKEDLKRDKVDKKESLDLKKLREEANSLSRTGDSRATVYEKMPVAAPKEAAPKQDRWKDWKESYEASKGGQPQVDKEAREDARDTLNALLGRTPQRQERKPAKKEERKLRVYTIQPGDNLFRIAEKFYGDPTDWKKIREANPTRILPDGRVRAGQSIVIP